MQGSSTPAIGFSSEISILRRTYCEPGFGCPAGVISRKIWVTIARSRGAVQKVDEEDVHQTACAAVLANFENIVNHFVTSGRDQTQRNFEAYLTTCINHLVVDAMRRQPRRVVSIEELEGFDWPAPETNPLRQVQMHALFATACESLTQLERDLIEKRLADRQKPAALAAELGLTPRRVHKLLYETKLRLRNELIRIVAEEKLRRQPILRQRFGLCIRDRCTLRRDCYFYRDPCELAYPMPSPDAAGNLASGSSDPDLARQAADLVREVLEDWNLPPTLDRCYWAATHGRGKTAAASVYQDAAQRAGT